MAIRKACSNLHNDPLIRCCFINLLKSNLEVELILIPRELSIFSNLHFIPSFDLIHNLNSLKCLQEFGPALIELNLKAISVFFSLGGVSDLVFLVLFALIVFEASVGLIPSPNFSLYLMIQKQNQWLKEIHQKEN